MFGDAYPPLTIFNSSTLKEVPLRIVFGDVRFLFSSVEVESEPEAVVVF